MSNVIITSTSIAAIGQSALVTVKGTAGSPVICQLMQGTTDVGGPQLGAPGPDGKFTVNLPAPNANPSPAYSVHASDGRTGGAEAPVPFPP
jgi:hypothetical protein